MLQNRPVPADRIRPVNRASVQEGGSCVLYWMTATRRVRWNFALDRSVEWARRRGRPLVLVEVLRVDEDHASARFHRFALDGMADNRDALVGSGVLYRPLVEREPGESSALLTRLARRASVIVTDESPELFHGGRDLFELRGLPVLVEAVDSLGLLPVRAADRTFRRAVDFRRHVQGALRRHLTFPSPSPLLYQRLRDPSSLPREVRRALPRSGSELLDGDPARLAALPIDGTVAPVPLQGGMAAGTRLLDAFVDGQLPRYADERDHPDAGGTSGLSPYLRYGHVAPHQVFAAVAASQTWSPEKLGRDRRGRREGWWGMDRHAEAFLDQLVVWRELGIHTASRIQGAQRYESLPGWARRTLEEHSGDAREATYPFEVLERAMTHDEIWNAAQTELRRTGMMHNRLRMLWGKKILEWSASPEEALQTMLTLNDRYALDGRDPNSVSGVTWVLGRYDRPWFPERPVFGRIRYMSSDAAVRKVRLTEYLARHSPQGEMFSGPGAG